MTGVEGNEAGERNKAGRYCQRIEYQHSQCIECLKREKGGGRLGQEGLCVPENVSVAVLGYADRRISESVILTGYENNEKNLAQMGIHVLKKRLENKRSAERIWTAEACFVKGNTVKKLDSC